MTRLAVLLALLCLAGLSGTASPARATETVIVCGDEEEPLPEVDEDGFIAEPDQSTEEDRAGDYDDSAEDQQIPEDEGDELTPSERAAIDRCLADATDRAMAAVKRALRKPWKRLKPPALMTFGREELPYGGRVDLTLRRRAGARLLGRARLDLRSGDQRRLRLRLTPAGKRALRSERRLKVLARLKLTDGLSGRSEARSARLVLKRKRQQ